MTDQFATLSGQRIVTGSVCIPYYGLWSADIVLATTNEIKENTDLIIANLSMKCHVFRMASFAGARSARLVGGLSGGWRQKISSQAYYNANGVKLSMVLGDVASKAKEQIKIQTDKTVGQYFVRESAIASEFLYQLLGDTWYIDEKGVLQAQDRTNSKLISTPFTVINWSGAKGKFEIATEDIASWMPGRTFSSPTVTSVQTISMTTITIENNGKLRLNILSTGHENA